MAWLSQKLAEPAIFKAEQAKINWVTLSRLSWFVIAILGNYFFFDVFLYSV